MDDEEKKEEEIIPINDEAPPVPMESNQIHNIMNNNNSNLNNNMNNINLKERDFINNYPKINENKQFPINNNINMRPQIPFINMNNSIQNSYQPYIIKNPIYPAYNMMNFNYFNQQLKNNINNSNNINMPYLHNNILQNSNNIIDNSNKNDSNLNELKIDIDNNALNKLNKENLIDIILYIRDFCQIQIETKYFHIGHELFRLKKDRIRGKGFLFFIKRKKLIELLNQNNENINNNTNKINDNNSDSSDDSYEDDNLIKETNFNNNINSFGNQQNKNSDINKYFYCEIHEKVYFNTDKKWHYAKHLKCPKCNLEFISKKKLRTHNRIEHIEKEQKKSDNNEIKISENIEPLKNNFNENKNEDKIKCSDCDLLFNTVELMSIHYYEIHEKNKTVHSVYDAIGCCLSATARLL